MVRASLLSLALGAAPQPAVAQEAANADQRAFSVAANTFAGCLRAAVELGMRVRMQPETFEAEFASMCLPQEAAFRDAALRVAVAGGQSSERARQEINDNIANGRRIFAADQATYFRTGKVPR